MAKSHNKRQKSEFNLVIISIIGSAIRRPSAGSIIVSLPNLGVEVKTFLREQYSSDADTQQNITTERPFGICCPTYQFDNFD